ncbi:MAG TPA: ribosome small subunit-dependent GTPase A [Coriobacteriia bacterium]|jgi:ribosome biogenesis GTPase
MTDSNRLTELGYSPRWEALFDEHIQRGLQPGRIIRADRGSLLVATEQGMVRAKPSTRLLKSASGPLDLPGTGDWVALLAPDDLDVPLVETVLDRVSAIVRGDPGGISDVQVLAANVDIVFVVHPIAQPPNLRRIERELSVAWDSGARPVVVLTKADLSPDVETAHRKVQDVAFGVDVVVTNALAGDGIEPLIDFIGEHRTAVLIGPSGAGKSTLVNALLGENRQATREVRVGDGRGRHTTVVREVIPLGGGSVLIDTPGLRALGLTGSEDGIASAFPDIEQLAHSCRFRDCRHVDEPGCAVLAAVESCVLSHDRLDSFHKLTREAQVVAAKTDARLRANEERKSKTISKVAKEYFRRFGHK